MDEQKNLEVNETEEVKETGFELYGFELGSFDSDMFYSLVSDMFMQIMDAAGASDDGTICPNDVVHRVQVNELGDMVAQVMVLARVGEFMVKTYPDFLKGERVLEEIEDYIEEFGDLLMAKRFFQYLDEADKKENRTEETDNG